MTECANQLNGLALADLVVFMEGILADEDNVPVFRHDEQQNTHNIYGGAHPQCWERIGGKYKRQNQLGKGLNQVRSDFNSEAAHELQLALHIYKSGAVNLHANIQSDPTQQFQKHNS